MVIKSEKIHILAKQLIFYMANLIIGFIFAFHLISSWIISRISYINYASVLNWLLITIITVCGIVVNYLCLKNESKKRKKVLKAFMVIACGFIFVSIYFIIVVNL